MLPESGPGVDGEVPQSGAPNSDVLGLHHIHQNCEQMEHRADWADDLFPRGGREHTGVVGLAGQMREQNPDPVENGFGLMF
jgi:hypothetical protein